MIDYRLPENREECFLDFYEYHLKLRGHPGCVYFIFPWMFIRHNFTMEQKLWFAYLNGCTQNPMTTWRIFQEFPDFDKVDLEELDNWHLSMHESGEPIWKTLSYDIDRRYQKGHLVKMVNNYKEQIGEGTQLEYFESFYDLDCPYKSFDNLWKAVKGDFLMFGRLSTFSYLEYLKICGIQIDCSNLFLEDMSGSLSHRNGLLKVMGLDHVEQHKKINPGLKHNKNTVLLTKSYGEELLKKAKLRFKDREFFHDVNYFTLESTLCCYKSSFRANRRYPNVYIDMMYDRIEDGYERWGVSLTDYKMWHQCRENCLPEYARNGGLTKEKQNHFRETGEVLFLGNMFPDKYRKGAENEIY